MRSLILPKLFPCLILTFFCVRGFGQSATNSPSVISFGLFDSQIPHDLRATAFRLHYSGQGLIPALHHQFGISYSPHTFVFANVGTAKTFPKFVFNVFIGPSLVYDKYENRPIYGPFGMIRNIPERRYGFGINANASFIVKPGGNLGFGVEVFLNKSTAGYSEGVGIILHLPNKG